MAILQIEKINFFALRSLSLINTLNTQSVTMQILRNSILLVSMLMFSGAVMADRPEWAGSRDSDGEKVQKNKHKHGRDRDDDERDSGRQQESYQTNRGGVEILIGGYFGDTQRSETHEYYRERSRSGHCPPGLAKKHNGCMPPGQAKKWVIGENLPREVIYKPIDPAIQIKLGMPPEGHKFVRVASDILLIAVGTGLVIDAIQDLGQ